MMKIGMLSVEQYVDAIKSIKPDEVPDKDDQPKFSVYESYAYAKKSYAKPGTTWNQFCAILVMFQYLYYDVSHNPALYQTALVMPAITGIAQTTSGENFTFGDNRVFPKKGEAKPFNLYKSILGAYTKKDCVADVLCWLYLSVDKNNEKNKDNQSKFKQLTTEGFGVNMDEKLIINQCQKMYAAGVKQIVFTGAPGTGKTYTVEHFAEEQVKKALEANNIQANNETIAKYIDKVQFHSSYDYSDFVEGLRPVIKEDNTEDKMVFVRMDGQFKKFCREIIAENNKKMPYFFIIDEINRADLSRVFGELMYCLDEANRDSKKGVTTQYSNLPTYQIIKKGEKTTAEVIDDKEFKDGFYIPENLYILATMNDIDRSVEAFDFALRRRFKWIEADANTEVEAALSPMLKNEYKKRLKNSEEGKDKSENALDEQAEEEVTKIMDGIAKLKKGIIQMNKVISDGEGRKLGLSSAYHIGHAYFKTYNGTEERLQEIWNTQISPILNEYCRGKDRTATQAFIDKCRRALLS